MTEDVLKPEGDKPEGEMPAKVAKPTPKKKKFSAKKLALGGGITVLVAAVGIMGYLLLSPKEAKPEFEQYHGGRGIIAAPRERDPEETVQDGSYEARMNVDWEFERWDKPSINAYVENAPSNTRTVYFDLRLDDTNELIYSSPYIPVGANLAEFTLDKHVTAGEYAAIVIYHLVDDEYNELSTVAVAVKLRINE